MLSTWQKRGHLAKYNAHGNARSHLCGSTISIYLLIEEECIIDFAQEVEACSFGAAAASIVATDICGCQH